MTRVLIKVKDGFVYDVITDTPGTYVWVYDLDEADIGEPPGPFSCPTTDVRRERFDELLAENKSGTPDG